MAEAPRRARAPKPRDEAFELDFGDPNRVSGTVERVTFHSEETGFCVLRVNAARRREPVTVVGTAVTVGPGEFVEANGTWVNDRSYGLQFRAEHLRVVPPSTLEGIEKYLGSGMIRGIGPHFAARLVRAFGAEVFEVIENDPDRLRELPGIGPKRQSQVVAAWAEQKAVREIMVFLQSHGVGSARAVRIYRLYGDRAVDRVREDPYRLTLDVRGIGFRTADAIAQSLGFEADSIPRARAGVRHVLQELAGEGHCAGERGALVEATAGLLEVEAEVVEGALARDLADEELVDETRDGDSWIYLPALHRSERGAAGHLGRLLGAGGPPRRGGTSIRRRRSRGRSSGWASSSRARSARRWPAPSASGSRSSRGDPGSGRPPSSTRCSASCARRGCAPASARRPAGPRSGSRSPPGSRHPPSIGCSSSTRRPEASAMDATSPSTPTSWSSTRCRWWTSSSRTSSSGPSRSTPPCSSSATSTSSLPSDRGRCSPTSSARSACRRCGSPRSSARPSPRASSSTRTGSTGASRRSIRGRRTGPRAREGGEGAETARGNAAPSDFYVIPVRDAEEARDRLLQVVTERIPRRFGFDPMADLQVLTPGRRGGLGATALNAELQSLLNPGSPARVNRYGTTYARGDKVLQTVNDYQKEVFNGDIGRIVAVDPEEQTVTVDFEGRPVPYEFSELDELSLAYAITVHKSQGSEFPAVVIPLTTQHYMLLERNLVYTGVTRGKRLVVLVAEPRALAIAVRRFESVQRRSRLAERLRGDI